MSYTPPSGGGGGTLTLVDKGAWTAFATYAPGNLFTAPDGSRWSVLQQYTAGATYQSGGVDGPPNTAFISGAGITQAAADLRYSPLGAGFLEVTVATGDLLLSGYNADTNGVDMIAAGNIHAIACLSDLPAAGSDVHVDIWKCPAATGIDAIVATATIAVGTVRGVLNPLGADIAVADGDKITPRVSQVGSTFPGRGLKVRLALNGRTFPNALATPGAPTGFAVTSSNANSITLGWTNGANATGVIIYRDSLPYDTITGTSYTDLGPNGTGLSAGETHQYAIQSRRFDSLGAVSGNIAGTALLTYQWVNGAIDPTMYRVMVGTSTPAPSVTYSSTSPVGIKTTGSNVGTFLAADKALVQHIKDTTAGASHTAATAYFLINPADAGDQWLVQVLASDQTAVGQSPSQHIDLNMSTSGCRLSGVLAGWDPTVGGRGTGAIGSTQTFTDSAYPTNQMGSLTRVAGGGINWPTTVTAGTAFGLGVEVLKVDVPSNTQTINIRQGSLAQFNTDPTQMPLMMQLVLTTSQVTALSAAGGYMCFGQTGSSSPGQTPIHSTTLQSVLYTPLTAANT